MIHRLLGFAFIACFVVIASCKLHPCDNYPCVNGQALEDGKNCVCLCKLGWEGVDCAVENKCVPNPCQNGGLCTGRTGLCSCPTGFEGDSCQIVSRNRFLAANGDTSFWHANDTCSLQFLSYKAKIRKGSYDTSLEIYNVNGIDSTVFVTVNVNKLVFNQITNVTVHSTVISNLKGTLSSDQNMLHIIYKADNTNCTGTWTRQ